MTEDPVRLLDEQADEEYELEAAEGSTWTGTRLLVGLVAMAWAAVAFSYFYLRAADTAGAWRPDHVTPPILFGTLIAACPLAGAITLTSGRRYLRRGYGFEWAAAAWVTVGIGLLGGGLQCWELARLSFYPGLSGYTSVFIGFAVLNAFFLLSGAFWPETVVARGLRLRSEFGRDLRLGVSPRPECRLLRASLDGCVYYWWFMMIISALFWVLFYIL